MSAQQWWVIVGLIPATLAGAIAVVFLRQRRAGKRVRARLAALRAAGAPTSIADLAPPPVADECNAAVILRRAQAELKKLVDECQGVETEDYESFAANSSGADAHEHSLSAAALDAISKIVEASPQVISALRAAADCKSCNWGTDYSVGFTQFLTGLLGDFERIRICVRAWRYAIESLLHRSRVEESLSDVVALLRLIRRFDNEPLMVYFLISEGCRGVAYELTNRILQSSLTSGEIREQLREELLQHDSLRTLRHAIITERAWGVAELTERGARFWNIHTDIEDYLSLIDAAIRRVDRPLSETSADAVMMSAYRAAGKRAKEVMCVTGLPQCIALRSNARNRCLAVISALVDFPRGIGRALDIERLGLPSSTTADPVNGESLIVREQTNGWLVYSVGEDLHDGGGDCAMAGGDWGFAPP